MLIFFLIYLALCIFFILNTRRVLYYTENIQDRNPPVNVSVIFPIKGKHEFLERCLRSWLAQKINGEIEFVFSLQDPKDPALPLLRNLPGTVLINDVLPGFSGKGSNLHYGFLSAKHETIAFIDSDIIAEPGTLSKMLSLVIDQKTLVSCLPVHIQAQNVWSRIYTFIWNIPLVCIWAAGMMVGNGVGVSGAAVVFRRELLDSIGGLKAFASYMAEDLMFGELVKRAGGHLALGPRVNSPVEAQSFSQLINNMRRAHLMGLHFNKISVAISVVGIFIGYGYVLLPLTGNLKLIFYWLGFVLVKLFFLTWIKLRFEKKLSFDFSFIIGDILNFILFFQSFLKKEVQWRGTTHKIGPGGRILY